MAALMEREYLDSANALSVKEEIEESTETSHYFVGENEEDVGFATPNQSKSKAVGESERMAEWLKSSENVISASHRKGDKLGDKFVLVNQGEEVEGDSVDEGEEGRHFYTGMSSAIKFQARATKGRRGNEESAEDEGDEEYIVVRRKLMEMRALVEQANGSNWALDEGGDRERFASEADDEDANLLEEVELMKGELEWTRQEFRRAAGELGRAREDVGRLTGRLDIAEGQLAVYKECYAEARDGRQNDDDLKAQAALLRKKVAYLEEWKVAGMHREEVLQSEVGKQAERLQACKVEALEAEQREHAVRREMQGHLTALRECQFALDDLERKEVGMKLNLQTMEEQLTELEDSRVAVEEAARVERSLRQEAGEHVIVYTKCKEEIKAGAIREQKLVSDAEAQQCELEHGYEVNQAALLREKELKEEEAILRATLEDSHVQIQEGKERAEAMMRELAEEKEVREEVQRAKTVAERERSELEAAVVLHEGVVRDLETTVKESRERESSVESELATERAVRSRVEAFFEEMNTKVAELQTKVAEEEAEVQKLTVADEQSRQKFGELTKEVGSLGSALKDSQAALREAEQREGEVKGEVQRMLNLLHDCESALHDMGVRESELAAEVVSREASLAEAQSALSVSREVEGVLEADLADTCAALEQCQLSLEESEISNTTQQSEMSVSQHALEECRADLAEGEERQRSLKAKVWDYQANLQTAVQMEVTLNNLLGKMESELKDKQVALQAAVSVQLSMSERLEERAREVEEAEVALEVARGREEELERDIEECHVAVGEMKNTEENLGMEILGHLEALNACQVAIEGGVSREAHMQSKVEELGTAIDVLQAEVVSRGEREEGLENEVDALKAGLEGALAAERKSEEGYETLSLGVERKAKALHQCQMELRDAMEREKVMEQEMDVKVSDLKSLLEEAEGREGDGRKEVEGLRVEVAGGKVRVTEGEKREAELRGGLGSHLSMLTECQVALTDGMEREQALQKQVEMSAAALQDCHLAVAAGEKKVEGLLEALQVLEGEVGEKRVSLEKAEGRERVLESGLQRLQEQVSVLEGCQVAISEYEEREEGLRGEKEEVIRKLLQMREVRSQLEMEVEEVRGAVARNEMVVRMKEEEIERVKAQVGGMQREQAGVREVMERLRESVSQMDGEKRAAEREVAIMVAREEEMGVKQAEAREGAEMALRKVSTLEDEAESMRRQLSASEAVEVSARLADEVAELRRCQANTVANATAAMAETGRLEREMKKLIEGHSAEKHAVFEEREVMRVEMSAERQRMKRVVRELEGKRRKEFEEEMGRVKENRSREVEMLRDEVARLKGRVEDGGPIRPVLAAITKNVESQRERLEGLGAGQIVIMPERNRYGLGGR